VADVYHRAVSDWRDRVPAWLPRVVIALGLGGLVAISAWRRWVLLDAVPFPVGIDGYFYPVQLRSLLETGHLQYPASPLTLWLMAPFAAATDPITGAKLGAAIGGALVAIPAYLVGARLGNGRGPGAIAAALAATSLGSTYLSVEFVKNGIGLGVGLLAIWLALRALDRPAILRGALALAGLVAAVLAHKMAAGLALLVIAPAVIVRARAHGRRLAIGAAILVAIAVIAGVAMPERFLSPGDLALLGDLFSETALWHAPALAVDDVELSLNHEPIAALVGGLAVIALAIARRRSARLGAWLGEAVPPHVEAAAIAVAAFGILVGFPYLAVDDPQALGFRLRLASFVPFALTLGIASRVVIGNLKQLDGDVLLVAIAAALTVAAPLRTSVPGEVTPHPAMVAAVAATAGKLPADTTAIVPERHLAYMVAWFAQTKIALRPEHARDRIYVLPLSFIGARSALDDAISAARREPSLVAPIGTHPRYVNGFVIVEEATWQWIVKRLPPDEQARVAAWPTI